MSGHRTLTIVAVGFLALDGVLFGLLGWWQGQAGFLVVGALLLLAAAGVLVWWRVYLRRLAEIHQARQAVKAELQALQDALRRSE